MEHRNFFMRNVHIFILLFIILLFGIFSPFILFFPLLLIFFIPLLIYFLLRKKLKILLSLILTLFLSLFVGIIITGVAGSIIYYDTLSLINDFETKPSYILYVSEPHLLFGYKYDPNEESSFAPLTYEELSGQREGIQLIVTKSFFSNQNLLLQLEQDLTEEERIDILLQLLTETAETTDLVTLFDHYRKDHLQIQPNYLLLNIIKGVPLIIVEQFNGYYEEFIEELPSNLQ